VTQFEELDTVDHDSKHRSFMQNTRLVFGLVLLVVVSAIVVDNRRSTKIGYVFGDVRVPLIVALLIAGVVGASIGWLLLHRPGRNT